MKASYNTVLFFLFFSNRVAAQQVGSLFLRWRDDVEFMPAVEG
jgi:hypothetical protein